MIYKGETRNIRVTLGKRNYEWVTLQDGDTIPQSVEYLFEDKLEEIVEVEPVKEEVVEVKEKPVHKLKFDADKLKKELNKKTKDAINDFAATHGITSEVTSSMKKGDMIDVIIKKLC